MNRDNRKLTVGLMVMNAVFWLLLMIRYIISNPARDWSGWPLLYLAIFAGEILMFIIMAIGVWRNIRLIKFGVIPLLTLNAVASLTDQMGAMDVISFLGSSITLTVYLIERKKTKTN